MVQTRSQKNPDRLKILYERFPLIFEKILLNVDTKTIVKSRQVSKYFKNCITNESQPVKKDIELWKNCLKKRKMYCKKKCDELDLEESKIEEELKELREDHKRIEKDMKMENFNDSFMSKFYRKKRLRLFRLEVLAIDCVRRQKLNSYYQLYAPEYEKAKKVYRNHKKLQCIKHI